MGWKTVLAMSFNGTSTNFLSSIFWWGTINVLEKIISSSPDKIVLAKINIDENQQIAAQLRIQSIPAVFAFKDKQPVNAFQGVIPETEIIKFLEKSLGEKLENNFDDFYDRIKILFNEKKFLEAKDLLEDFIAKNTQETKQDDHTWLFQRNKAGPTIMMTY